MVGMVGYPVDRDIPIEPQMVEGGQGANHGELCACAIPTPRQTTSGLSHKSTPGLTVRILSPSLFFFLSFFNPPTTPVGLEDEHQEETFCRTMPRGFYLGL